MNHVLKRSVLLLSLVGASTAAFAYTKIDGAEAAKLGTELTPLGANPKANADGTIPAWTGSILGVPAGLNYAGSGSPYPDPYAKEKPLFSITNANLDKYKDKLSEGAVALFKKYSDFRMDIYPTHRDFRYNQMHEARTKWNVGNAELVNGVDGMQKMTGAVPFPIPQDGAEVIWNARINQPIPVADSLFDDIGIYANGDRQLFRANMIIESPYAYDSHPVGKVVEEIGINAALVFIEQIEPKRKKGEMVIVHEPLDQVQHDRQAWVYIPGAQRVKRAPNAGYDTPVGPGGLLTADDNMGFNGAMNRYDWKLIGKKELYIPYNNYGFDSADVKYDKLLNSKFVNPDYERYELHRVWIVEANLKEGQRHLYAKRRFYVDEDNWLIAATDAYDGRGQLWRVSLQNTLYDYYLKGFIVRSQFNYDLQAAAYVAARLVNETRPSNYAMKIKGEDFYTPGNLRTLTHKNTK
jgi:hypothetical protein